MNASAPGRSRVEKGKGAQPWSGKAILYSFKAAMQTHVERRYENLQYLQADKRVTEWDRCWVSTGLL